VRDEDGMFVVGFDADGQVCGVAVNSRHRALSWLKMWELAELANELGTNRLAVVVRIAGRGARPSDHERAVFRDLRVRARHAGIALVAGFVWRSDRWWSLAEEPGDRVSA
jgi:hypothetical protein